MSKQDRQGARTVSELEQRYSFERRFAEVMGVATDARDRATEAKKAFEGLTQEEIFNRLTNHGTWEGMYEEDGNVYINASYIKSGSLSADLIKAGKIKSINYAEDAEGNLTRGMMIDVENGIIDSLKFSVNGLGEVIALGGRIGGWNLGLATINVNPTTVISDYALYSDELTEQRIDVNNGGYTRNYTYRVFLTAKGVYVDGRYDTANENGVPYYANKTWLEICGG
jgi:hypothetical protein